MLDYYKTLKKYIKAEGNENDESIDGRIVGGRTPKPNEIMDRIQKLKKMYDDNVIIWNVKEYFVPPPNEPRELQYF